MVLMDSQLTKSLARYQHARRVNGLLFLAGQGCREPSSNQCVGLTRNQDGSIKAYDIVTQTLGVFKNMERVLSSFQLERQHLVDVTVFLTDMQDFEQMNKVWNEFFANCEPPARTTVAVKQLPGENFIEMKAVAAFPEGK
jgi:reactive intermediate/imine deaminase